MVRKGLLLQGEMTESHRKDHLVVVPLGETPAVEEVVVEVVVTSLPMIKRRSERNVGRRERRKAEEDEA